MALLSWKMYQRFNLLEKMCPCQTSAGGGPKDIARNLVIFWSIAKMSNQPSSQYYK